MTIAEVINQMRKNLPLEWPGSSLTDTLYDKFKEYLSLLNNIDDNEFDTLFKSRSSKKESKLTKRKFISLVAKIQNTINSIIHIYYEGYPDEAYKMLEELLEKNKFAPDREGIRCSSAYDYLDDMLRNFFSVVWAKETVNLYRMRISDEILSKEKLFHVPFDRREKVSTARFSIPGYPCLYFGTSLKVCWNEIKRPLKEKEKIYACRYQNQGALTLLNLTIPPECQETILNDDPYFVFNFLATYPFYLSCLIKVKEPKEPFKPEYIIPQLLLQYIKKEYLLKGIIYSSTKDCLLTGEKYNNVVIPTREITGQGHCKEAMGLFPTTDARPVDSTDIGKSEEELNSLPLQELR